MVVEVGMTAYIAFANENDNRTNGDEQAEFVVVGTWRQMLAFVKTICERFPGTTPTMFVAANEAEHQDLVEMIKDYGPCQAVDLRR